MAGHNITPYEIMATRKYAKKDKDKRLLLASLAPEDVTIDLLDLVENNLLGVLSVSNRDSTQTMTPMALRRDGDTVSFVFACDIAGEREVVHDGDDPSRPVVFTKNKQHVARYYSCCLLWRPAGGDQGIFLVHSPWGRGGSRRRSLTLLQRAVNVEPLSKARLQALPMIPQKELERIVRDMNATRIEYQRTARIRSEFDEKDHTTQAALNVVVKGSDSKPFRDALGAALGSAANRDKFFKLKFPGDGPGSDEREESFDDVEIDLKTQAGIRRYSLKKDTLPTVGFNKTSEINNVYYGLPDGQHDQWPQILLDGVYPVLNDVLQAVKP